MHDDVHDSFYYGRNKVEIIEGLRLKNLCSAKNYNDF